MGLAASQARLLMSIARKSDIEYRGQQINQRRIALSYQSSEEAAKLSESLSNHIMEVKISSTETLSLAQFLNQKNGENYQLVDRVDGSVIDESEYYDLTLSKEENEVLRKQLEEKINNGDFVIQKNTGTLDKPVWETINPEEITGFKDRLYTEDDAVAQAEWDSVSAKLQAEDKQLEMELKNIDTQHQAVQTEIDAVKKVIDKNIEMSFKTFG